MALRWSTIMVFLCFRIPCDGDVGFSDQSHAAIMRAVFERADREGWHDLVMGDILVNVGMSFLSAPYVAHTLESEGPEKLVVNLSQFDCATFVDSCLALARCIKAQDMTEDRFREELAFIRYRSGRLHGYASRLHYFSDWIGDGEAKSLVRDVTSDLGGVAWQRSIAFMSTHPASYPKLGDESVRRKIAKIERRLSQQVMAVIPLDRIQAACSRIANGDIIALTCTQPGLDIAHVGFAVHRATDAAPSFLHASSAKKVVTLTEVSLAAYAQEHPRADGLMIIRALDPDTSVSDSKSTLTQ